MADKKGDHGDGGSSDAGLWIIIGIVVLVVALFGLPRLFNPTYLNIEYFFTKLLSVRDIAVNPNSWNVVAAISSILSIFFIGIIIFCLVRMREIQNHEKEEIDHEIHLALAHDAEIDKKRNPRWEHVLALLASPSESDWRMAIIEADSMLDDLLQEKGYSGDSLGERLTNARSDAFSTIDNAWEAHAIRNKIAHQGSTFSLTQLETRRTIRLYETIFEEFGII